MLASLSKDAPTIYISYELYFWALYDLWTRPGQSEDRGQVMWDILQTLEDLFKMI
jgi:hypothetical protein